MKHFTQDPVLILLMGLTVLFAIGMMVVQLRFPDNTGAFQALYGLTQMFAGAVILRVKPQSKDDGLETKSQVKITESAVPTVGSKDNG